MVVSYVSEFFDNRRISFRKDIFMVFSGRVVEVVQSGFIAAHISFVQQKESLNGTGDRIARRYLGDNRRDDLFIIVPAGREYKASYQKEYTYMNF